MEELWVWYAVHWLEIVILAVGAVKPTVGHRLRVHDARFSLEGMAIFGAL